MPFSLKILEFLLKFPDLHTNLKALINLQTIVGAPGWEFMSKKVAEDQSLKEAIKNVYQHNPQTRNIIANILRTVDQNLKNRSVK